MSSCSACNKRTSGFCLSHKLSICDNCVVTSGAHSNCNCGNYFDFVILSEQAVLEKSVAQCPYCNISIDRHSPAQPRLVCRCLIHTDCLLKLLRATPSQCPRCTTSILDLERQPRSALRSAMEQFIQSHQPSITIPTASPSVSIVSSSSSSATVSPPMTEVTAPEPVIINVSDSVQAVLAREPQSSSSSVARPNWLLRLFGSLSKFERFVALILVICVISLWFSNREPGRCRMKKNPGDIFLLCAYVYFCVWCVKRSNSEQWIDHRTFPGFKILSGSKSFFRSRIVCIVAAVLVAGSRALFC